VRERQFSVGLGVVADADEVPVVDDDHGVVGGVAELVELLGEPPGPAVAADDPPGAS
jgi:hypothetical protein